MASSMLRGKLDRGISIELGDSIVGSVVSGETRESLLSISGGLDG
jgi:hypothetical protein